MSRSLIIVLIASLALNIFAGGFFFGRLIAPEPEAPTLADRPAPRGPDSPFRMMRYAEVLPAESREAFREVFRMQLPALRERHEEARRLRTEFSGLMQAEEWDRDAVAAKLTEIDAAQKKQRDAFNEVYVAAFEKLSAEERRLLMAEAAIRREKRRLRRKGPKGDRPEGPPPQE